MTQIRAAARPLAPPAEDTAPGPAAGLSWEGKDAISTKRKRKDVPDTLLMDFQTADHSVGFGLPVGVKGWTPPPGRSLESSQEGRSKEVWTATSLDTPLSIAGDWLPACWSAVRGHHIWRCGPLDWTYRTRNCTWPRCPGHQRHNRA